MARLALRDTLLAAWLALMAISASARVEEDVAREAYLVMHERGKTLLEALNQATPIRRNGQFYHAYTAWQVHWNFRTWREASGVCRISSLTTQLKVRITLPALTTGDPGLAGEFGKYSQALESHEGGHHAIARETAHAVDQTLAGMSDPGGCHALSEQANRAASELIEDARRREREYDMRTRYGCTQGACLVQPGR